MLTVTFAECHIKAHMLSVVMLNVVMLSVMVPFCHKIYLSFFTFFGKKITSYICAQFDKPKR
jgi:hypothetical protein